MTIKIGPINLNSFTDMSEDSQQEVCDYLDARHTELVHDENSKESLLFGLEYVLQGLGAEGYEFS